MRDRQALLGHLQLRHLIPAALLLAGLPARAQDALPRVLVVPYRVDKAIPVEPATADAILVARLTKVKTVSIISQQELERLGNYQSMLQGLGQDDVQGLVALGKAAEAELIISGELGDVGGTTAGTLVLIDVRSGEVQQRFAGTARGGRDLVIPLLTGQADGMLAHLLRTYAPQKLRARVVEAPPPPPPSRLPSVVSLGLVGGGMLLAGLGVGGAVASVAAGCASGLMLYRAMTQAVLGSRAGSTDPSVTFLGLAAVAGGGVALGTVLLLAGAAVTAGGVVYRAALEP